MAPVLQMAETLADAEQAFARTKARGAQPGATVCKDAACPEQCPVCTYRCALTFRCVEAFREQLATAMGQDEPLTHSGRFYVAAEGRA
jgi:Tfp pilus assembly protein PilX